MLDSNRLPNVDCPRVIPSVSATLATIELGTTWHIQFTKYIATVYQSLATDKLQNEISTFRSRV